MNFKLKQPVYLCNEKNSFLVSQVVDMNQSHENIKTILFKGINNKNLKNKIFRYLRIHKSFKLKQQLSSSNVDFILNTLKQSGFFNKIKVSHLSFNHYQYLIIELCLQPVLKHIVVKNASTLKIPNSYLSFILKKPIGYPKSLNLIHNIINKIQSWYVIRGYKWVRILYNISASNENKLEIAILETQISEIKTICMNDRVKGHKHNLRSLIISELKIFPGQSLNFYNIELGIIKLKTQKLISSCNYEIQYTSNNTIKIFIKYRRLEEKASYLFNRSIYSAYKFFDLVYHKTHIAFNHLLHNFDSSIYYKWIINRHVNLQAYANFFSSNNTNYNNLFLSSFLYTKNIIKHKYKCDPFLLLQNNLRFKHCFNNLNRDFSNLIIDIEKDDESIQFIIAYKYPKLRSSYYYESQFLISIFQNIYKFKSNILKAVFEQIKHKKSLFANCYNSFGAEVASINDLSSNISIFKKLSLSNDIYRKDFLYQRNSWRVFYNFFKLTNETLKNKFCMISNKFIYYVINIKSDVLNFKRELIPSNSWNFSVRSYMPFTICCKDTSKKNIMNHLLIIKYCKIADLYTSSINNAVNTLILSVQLKTFWGSIRSIPIYVLNHLNGLQKKQWRNNNTKTRMYQYFYVDLEYHLYKKYNVCLFLFSDYKQYFNDFSFYFINYRLSRKKQSNWFWGIGLQITLPIKQIPIIKVKYEINKHKICRLYTKLHFK